MDSADLIQALHAKNFRPVELHMADGRALRVDHPDYFLLFPTKKSAWFFPTECISNWWMSPRSPG